MLASLLIFVVAYLIGSFPSAFLVAKLKGENIFAVGSGNMGAMNTARNLGYGLGALVLGLDVGKGLLATWLGLQVSSPEFLLPAFVATVGVVAGHAWSLFLAFKGGKALATAWGTSLVLYPLGGVVAMLLLVVLTVTLKGRSNLAAVVTALAFPLIVFVSSSSSYGVSQGGLAFMGSAAVAAIITTKYWPGLVEERRKTKERQGA